VLLLAVPLGLVGAGFGPSTASAATVTQESVVITAADGIPINALVDRPATAQAYPLVIVPGHWGEQPANNASLAGMGFEVIDYAQRGFGGSGGQVDFAGPSTISDFESVLNWAIVHTSVDQSHISGLGVSYGAVTVLLGAEQDPRVTSVVAISPWGTFANLIAAGGAVNSVVTDGLLRNVNLSPEITALRADMIGDHSAAVALASQLSPVRSPLLDVAGLNARHVPVLLAGSLEDSLPPSSDVVSLFTALTGPKRLVLMQGDHDAVGSAAAYGVDGPWFAAAAWLVKYGAGRTVDPADLTPTVAIGLEESKSIVSAVSWPSGLGASYALSGSGTAIPTPAALTWNKTIVRGVSTPADSGPALPQSTRTYVPPKFSMWSIHANAAVVWAAPAVRTATTVCGSPTITYGVASSANTAPVFTYVEDVNRYGRARLMSATPLFLTGLTPGVVDPVALTLRPVYATLPAGDHLAVVVDTVDRRYPSPYLKGTVTISSSSTWPARLSI
jgi:predicted acyl esterase